MSFACALSRLSIGSRRALRVSTIRGQILLAFVAVSLISVVLGVIAVLDLRRDGAMVDRTFDRSLMSINYARAASADFNAIQAGFARYVFADDEATRLELQKHIGELEAALDDDLGIAVERAQSDRAQLAAQKVSGAVAIWKKARWALRDGADHDKVWRALDHQALVVAQQLDLLINYTAGDGFTIRQAAHRAILEDCRFVILAVGGAIVLSGLIAFLLWRRIIALIKKASEVARRIADGELDTIVPSEGRDELGTMLAAMEVMRRNIKRSMAHEVAMRESAQMRLAHSLESSREGVIVIDAHSRIALANAQASILLRSVRETIQVGETADDLVRSIAALTGATLEAVDASMTREALLPDESWLRISQNATNDGGSIIVCGDITLVKAQEAALKASNLWLDAALSNLSQGLCLFDARHGLRVFNKRFCEVFEIEPDRVKPGMLLAEIAALIFAQDETVAAGRDPVLAAEMHIRRRTAADDLLTLSSGRKVLVSHRPLEDDSWLATFEDVTDRLQAQQKIAFMARHDALTGLPNRVLFAERVEIALAASGCGESFALLCLDLDHFKQVNDTLGHPFGDELLRAVGDRLASCIRETDMVARLSGDEFAIVQTNVAGPDDATLLAGRITEMLKVPFDIDGNRITVGVSIGISLAPIDGTSYGKLLKNADVALYKAKADGRNTWRFFESEMDERLQARRLLEMDLRDAVETEQFELHYQPLYDVACERVTGAEALIRWTHPKRGAVAPSDFIPLAEEIGLITRIGDWVLERACRDAALWPNGASVAVNVSAAQVREGGLVRKVIEVLYSTGLSANRLDLEITESVLLANTGSTLSTLNQLRDIGVRISMDDFGTGFSSLSYLCSFPFDKVKIDRSFIRDVTTSAESRAIVRSIISLCRDLGMRTTAEGVETVEQMAFLRAENCDQLQGFHFSSAVPTATVADFIAQGRWESLPLPVPMLLIA